MTRVTRGHQLHMTQNAHASRVGVGQRKSLPPPGTANVFNGSTASGSDRQKSAKNCHSPAPKIAGAGAIAPQYLKNVSSEVLLPDRYPELSLFSMMEKININRIFTSSSICPVNIEQ